MYKRQVQARFAPDAPEEYYKLVAQLAASGRNVLSVFNDRTIIAAQIRMGKQEADARFYLNGGCQEVLLADMEVNSRATCYLSPCRYLEMMLEPDGTVFLIGSILFPTMCWLRRILRRSITV